MSIDQRAAAVISTPYTAYQWCRALGLDHEMCVQLVASREKFEFFAECLRELERLGEAVSDWKFLLLPDGRYQSPGGAVLSAEQFRAAVALYQPRCSTLKELCLEIDHLFNWTQR